MQRDKSSNIIFVWLRANPMNCFTLRSMTESAAALKTETFYRLRDLVHSESSLGGATSAVAVSRADPGSVGALCPSGAV